MKDTLQGSIFELLSAVEGLSIALFEELVGTGLKEGTQGLTEMINKLTDNAAKVAEQIRIVGKFIGTLIKVTLAYKAFNFVVSSGNRIIVGAGQMATNFSKNLGKLRTGANVASVSFRTLGIAIKGAFIATGVGVLVVAITELVSSLSDVEDEAQRATRSFEYLDKAQERFNITMERTNKLLGTQPKSLEEVKELNEEIAKNTDEVTLENQEININLINY